MNGGTGTPPDPDAVADRDGFFCSDPDCPIMATRSGKKAAFARMMDNVRARSFLLGLGRRRA